MVNTYWEYRFCKTCSYVSNVNVYDHKLIAKVIYNNGKMNAGEHRDLYSEEQKINIKSSV